MLIHPLLIYHSNDFLLTVGFCFALPCFALLFIYPFKLKYNLHSRAPCLAHGDCDNAATLPNALAVASGQSAQMHALLTFMQAGDNFVSASELYGGTHTQFGHSFKQIGIDAKFADVSDIDQIKSLIDDNTKVGSFDYTCSIAYSRW